MALWCNCTLDKCFNIIGKVDFFSNIFFFKITKKLPINDKFITRARLSKIEQYITIPLFF